MKSGNHLTYDLRKIVYTIRVSPGWPAFAGHDGIISVILGDLRAIEVYAVAMVAPAMAAPGAIFR